MATTNERFTFLHAADLHIDSPLRGLERYEEAPAEEIRGASRRAFENLVGRAIELQVAFVILAGDVFDGNWKDFGTGLWFAARLRELATAGIRVYIVAGNHDAQGKMTMQLPYPEKEVRVFHAKGPETVVDEPTGVVLHGQSFRRADTTEDLAAGYPAATPDALNIGILHTALNGREGHDAYAPCSTDTLRAKGYDYWALGHVHQREIVSEDPWIVFPGNLQARHVRESGAKGATLVSVEEGRVTSVSEETFDVVRFTSLSVDVSACATRAACEEAVSGALDEARDTAGGRLLAARIELIGRTAVDANLRSSSDAFIAACRNRANATGDVWVEKVKIATRGTGAASGHDIVEALELDADDLRAAVLDAARDDLEILLAKLPPGLDLAAVGLDLRDEATLARLLGDAREEVLSRLIEADVDAATNPEEGA